MGKKMPKLEAGMMIIVDWRCPSIEDIRYLCLGGDATIDLDNVNDRSQPLRETDCEIIAIYDVGGHNSIKNLTEKDGFYSPKLLWEKNAKSPEAEKIEELEKTIKEATAQIGELKKVIK